MLAVIESTPMGGYVSIAKVVTMFVLALPWLWVAPWAQRDARRIGLSPQLSGGGILAAGAAGMFLWLVLPSFLAGLIVFVVLVVASTVGWLVFRDGKVADAYRVLSTQNLKSRLQRNDSRKVEIETRLKAYDSDGRQAPVPDETAPAEAKTTYNLAQKFLYDVLYYRASEADLAPTGQEARLRFVVDGALVDQPALETDESEMVIQYVKSLAGLDVTERRKPQQGTLSVDLVNEPVDMVVTTAGTTSGQRLQLRVVKESIHIQIDELGVPDDLLAQVQDANQVGPGLILVTARPKNGLTSTLYSLLRRHDSFTMQLTTLEPRIASELENVSQHAYKSDAETENKQLVTALRHEPHVIMIDQCADGNVAKTILEGAAERLFLLGLPASDSFTAMAKWIKLCGDPTAALAPLKLVLAQVLIRKLCEECREAYRPDPNLLAKANISADEVKALYRPPTKPREDDKGKPLVDENGEPLPCPSCNGTGYFGRTAIFELLEVTDDLKELVLSGASLSAIKAACRKNKMLYLQEQALKKVIAGVTSIQEVIRVTQTSSKSKSKPKS